MNLHQLLQQREADGRPVRVGLIGAGRFGAMFLAQVQTTPGIRVPLVVDINPERALSTLDVIAWPESQRVGTAAEALAGGGLAIIDNADPLFDGGIDIIVEATGNPIAGIEYATRAIDAGIDIIMVNVEADVLAGPALAERARRAGTIYSLAYGDQPAIIAEQVDWARTSGFEVVCAGKGTKYLPSYHKLNPDTIWDIWQYTPEFIEQARLNPYLHTSFRDGTKAAIEMAAVANAAGLKPSDNGLTFEPADVYNLSKIQVPKADGGVLDHSGTVDVVSSLYRDGTWVPNHVQEGTFVVIEAENPYSRASFREGEWHANGDRFVAMYRPYHFVGLELAVSVASISEHRAATGAAIGFHGDVIACAKKALRAGEVLDGEGGFAVWGKSVSAELSVREGALPIGLAHKVPLRVEKAEGEIIRWDDVDLPAALDAAIAVRREAEALVAVDQ